jgi:HD-GYP domain-containing protein (c-di-GMP phosphodiesterase class II)
VSDASSKRIALDRYARMLRGTVGAPCSVAYLGPELEEPWISQGSDVKALEGALEELGDFDPASASAGHVNRLETRSGRSLLLAPVELGAARFGRLVLLLGEGLPQDRLSALEGMLGDVAVCATNEHRVAEEADTLAEELSSRYEELNLLYTMEGSVRASDDGVAGTEALLRNLVERLEIDLAALVLADRPEPIYVSGLAHPLRDLDLVLTAIRGDLFRFAATAKGPIVLNSAKDPRRQYLFVNMPYRILACPVLDQGQTRAMLVMLRLGNATEFSNGDRNLGMVIANQTAILMQNHAMLHSLANFGAEVAASLIEAIEAKDPYTRGHSERVQGGGVRLAKAAELGAEAIEDISWGALLHDVGKIGIPDAIICKAGTLTDDEYTMMKTHSERSYEIIRHIEPLRHEALNAARHHHERFDGGGYPQGLRGKQIPIEARVVSIADTYDALTSSRSYRAGHSHDEAIEIIRDVAGTQLAPDLVQVFDNMWERGDAPLKGPEEPEDG